MDYIHALLPMHEENGRALQRSMPELPPRAVRELVANALIRQDLPRQQNLWVNSGSGRSPSV